MSTNAERESDIPTTDVFQPVVKNDNSNRGVTSNEFVVALESAARSENENGRESTAFEPMYSKMKQELIYENGQEPATLSMNIDKDKASENDKKHENNVTIVPSMVPNWGNPNFEKTEAFLFEPPKFDASTNDLLNEFSDATNIAIGKIENNENNNEKKKEELNSDNSNDSINNVNHYKSNGYRMVGSIDKVDIENNNKIMAISCEDNVDHRDNHMDSVENDRMPDITPTDSPNRPLKENFDIRPRHSKPSNTENTIAARYDHHEAGLTRGNLDKKTPWYIINKHKIKAFLFEKFYILQWFPKYDRKNWLSNDIQAGIGVATMAIPQAIAYSNLVGLTPDVGLYTAMIGLLIYPLFGTSRHITVGTASISAIMTASLLSQFSELDNYHVYINTMALTSGIMFTIMSFLGIGFIASFLALPVVIGFTAGCAWVIAASQLKYVFSIKEGGSTFLTNLALLRYIKKFSWASIIITIICILILQFVKRMPPYWDKLLKKDEPSRKTDNGTTHQPSYSDCKRKCLSISSKLFRQMPIALLLLVVFTLISYFANGFSSLVNDWDENEFVFLVGKVNASVDFSNLGNFIDFSLFFDHGYTELLILNSLLLCIISFTQHIVASVNYGMKYEYDIIAGQELLGLGSVNIVGSLFGIFPAAGVITHLPMSEQSNVKTLVFNWVTGVIIIFTFILLVLLPNLLYYLPKSVLAAIVLNACIGMFPWSEMKHVGKIDTRDTLLMIVTFLSTLLIGIAEGVAVGFVFSIVLSIWRTSKPHCAILGRIPQTTIYRSIVAWPDAITTPGIIIFRFDGTLYFGNTAYFKQAIQVVCERYHRMHMNNSNSNENEHNNHNDSGFYFFILDCHCINDIDSSGINAIEKIEKMLSNTFGATLMLTGVKYPVMKHIERSGLLNIVGMHHFFHTVHEAKLYIWRRLKLLKSESFNVKDKHGYINTGKKQRQKRKREKQRQIEEEIQMTSKVGNEDKGKKNDSNVKSDKLSVKFLKSAADDSGYSLHESDITNNSMSTNIRGTKDDTHDIRLDRATSIQMKEAPPLTNDEIMQLRKGTRNVPMGSKLERQFDVSPQRATSIRKQFSNVLNKQDSKNENDITDETNDNETKDSGQKIGVKTSGIGNIHLNVIDDNENENDNDKDGTSKHIEFGD